MNMIAMIAAIDPIYGRIARVVPRTIDPMLREDILSDVYLAIREGALHPRDIEGRSGKFVSAAFKAFRSHWGDISLDAPRGSDSDLTLMDTLVDDQALEAFDRIFEALS